MIYWWCFEYVWIFLIFLIKLLNMKHLSIEHWTWTTNILEDHWTNVENISFKASGGQWFRRLSWKRKMFNWKWRRHFGDDGHLWIPCGFAVSSINMPIWIHKTMIFFWDMGQPRYLDKESFKHLVFCYIFWYHYIYIYISTLHARLAPNGQRQWKQVRGAPQQVWKQNGWNIQPFWGINAWSKSMSDINNIWYFDIFCRYMFPNNKQRSTLMVKLSFDLFE